MENQGKPRRTGENRGKPKKIGENQGKSRKAETDFLFFEQKKNLKSSFDALDRLYRPEYGGFLGTVLHNSF